MEINSAQCRYWQQLSRIREYDFSCSASLAVYFFQFRIRVYVPLIVVRGFFFLTFTYLHFGRLITAIYVLFSLTWYWNAKIKVYF